MNLLERLPLERGKFLFIPMEVCMLEMTYQILFLGSPLLPAAIAHGVCIKYDWLNGLKRPLDFGLKFKGKRILGDHKTLRAPLIYVFFCTLGTMIQAWLQSRGYLPQWLFLADSAGSRHGRWGIA